MGPMTTPPDRPRSAASQAMFDADDPTAGVQIARAAAGDVVVLCCADGTRHVLEPRAPAAA